MRLLAVVTAATLPGAACHVTTRTEITRAEEQRWKGVPRQEWTP